MLAQCTLSSQDTRRGASQPLLSHDNPGKAVDEPSAGSRSFKIQLAALCWVRLVDPIAYTQAFPYVNELIAGLHVTDDPSWVGTYSGLLESAFAVSQLFAIYHFARISGTLNKVGRRPVILVGLIGIGTCTLLFGLSRTLTRLFVSRFLSGLFAGNLAVIQSALGEITNSSNQAFAVSVYGLLWPFGNIAGPLIGGTFSKPAEHFPKTFDYEIFRTFPYFLPCFLTASVAAIGILAGYFILQETLPSKRRDIGVAYERNSYGTVENSHGSDRPLSVREMLSIPIIRSLCASAFALNFIYTSFDVIFVLFCYSPVSSGGLGFPAAHIGYSMATSGMIGMTIQVFILRTLLIKFDHAKLLHFCMKVWPFTFLSLPLLNMLARSGFDSRTGVISHDTTAILWVGIAMVLTLVRIGCVCYSMSLVLAKTYAPEGNLGMTNGMITWSMCLARAAAPTFVSFMFSLSMDNNLLGGHLWALAMACIALFGSLAARQIVRVSQNPQDKI